MGWLFMIIKYHKYSSCNDSSSSRSRILFTLNFSNLYHLFCPHTYFTLILCCSVPVLSLSALLISKACCVPELAVDVCCNNTWDEM